MHRGLEVISSRADSLARFIESYSKLARLPNDYFEYAQEIETPVLFMTGNANRVFTDSNVYCFDRLEKLVPGRHELVVFPNYGHQDVFMGKNNHIDIFPRLVEFLNKHSAHAGAAPAAAD